MQLHIHYYANLKHEHLYRLIGAEYTADTRMSHIAVYLRPYPVILVINSGV